MSKLSIFRRFTSKRCGAQFLSDNRGGGLLLIVGPTLGAIGGCRDRWNNSGELFALPTSKSVLKCNVLHQIQYHACEPCGIGVF